MHHRRLYLGKGKIKLPQAGKSEKKVIENTVYSLIPSQHPFFPLP